MSTPLISIVIPVFNVQEYLPACLDSIINQTYPNLEIILVDDGSLDSSGTICDKYKIKDNRITVIHQENMGLSGARNSGMRIASGDYISFVDSDDFLDTNYFEVLMTALMESSSDIALSSVAYCDENGSLLYTVSVPHKTIYNDLDQLRTLLCNSNYYPTVAWAKLYKKQLFDGVNYPEKKYHEDVFTTYKVVEKSKKSIAVCDVNYWYRQVASGITHSCFQIKHLDSLYASIERAAYIENNYPDLSTAANAAVAYSACKLFEKMIIDDFHDKNIEKVILTNLRENTTKLLRIKQYSMRTKVFSLIASCDLRIARALYKCLEKLR